MSGTTEIATMASAYCLALPEDERDEEEAIRRCRVLYCQLDAPQTAADHAAVAALRGRPEET